LLLVILGFCCYGLVAEWPKVQPTVTRLHLYSIAASLAASMGAAFCMMLAWRRLLADLGSKLPVLVAARVTFVSQLGKYVPGAVWSFAAHVELGHDYDVPRRRGAASVAVALAVAVGVGLLIAAVALPFAAPDVARKYLLVVAAVPVIAVCLAPPVLSRGLNLALRVIRQEPLEHPISWRGMVIALGWTVAGWLLFGLQTWVLLANVVNDGARSMLLALGAYAFASSAALLLVVFPGGIGAREVLLVAALAPALASGPALAIALAARLVTTVCDLTWGGIGLALARRMRGTTEPDALDSATGGHVGRHRKTIAALAPDRANARPGESVPPGHGLRA
jgi:uncharacterized membrane protein YbhN (UPF0104 family)